jgi:AraC-like DNA-binding protein
MKIEEIFDIDNTIAIKPIGSIHTKNMYEVKEHQSFHNTYNYERQYLKYIEDGNITGIKAFFLKPMPIKAGIVAENNLRQIKNLFIAAITTAIRSAIRGGLDIEVAYQLSDTYILQMEKMQDIDAVYHLSYAMIVDFTTRVSNSKIPSGITPDVYKCIQFISTNTNQRINVSDIAANIGKSRSYISRKFKAEMGLDLNTYIMNKKLEEAKSLLAFTDKSINEISNYLCFSSQGYFQNVFKKIYGITPNEYRNQSNSH